MANVLTQLRLGNAVTGEGALWIIYDGDPSGINSAPRGSLGTNTNTGELFYNADGGTTWTPWGSGGGVALGTLNFDAFSRLRVSNPVTLTDTKLTIDEQPLTWSERVVDNTGGGYGGGGAGSLYVQDDALKILQTGTASGDLVVRQYKFFANYEPGKGQLCFATGRIAPGGLKADVRRRIGFFDADDGFFLEASGTTINFVRRSSSTSPTVVTPQANWSVDPMDGTGPSGINLDFTKEQILYCDFEWLGVGTARLGFDVGGELYWAHSFEQANIGTSVYMQTGSVPIRYEIENLGVVTGPNQLWAHCGTIISEGGVDPQSINFSADNDWTHRNVGTAWEPLLSIRLQDPSGAAANSRERLSAKANVLPRSLSVHSITTNSNVLWRAVLNPKWTVAPAAWTKVKGSVVEYSVSATATVNAAPEGVVLAAGYFTAGTRGGSGSGDFANAIRLGSTYLGGKTAPVYGTQQLGTYVTGAAFSGRDIIVIVAKAQTGTANLTAQIQWRELL